MADRTNLQTHKFILAGVVSLCAVATGAAIAIGSDVKMVLTLMLIALLLLLSSAYPIFALCLYPVCLIDAVQQRLVFHGITPAIYLGALVVWGWMAHMARRRVERADAIWPTLLLLVFPAVLLARFLTTGADLRIVFTFYSQVAVIVAATSILSTPAKLFNVTASIVLIGTIMAVAQIVTLVFGGLTDLLSSSLQFGRYVRIAGLARDPNYGSLVMNIAFGYAFALALRNTYSVRKIERLLIIVSCATLGIGVVLSASRAGLIALFSVVLFLTIRSARKVTVSAILLVSIVALGFSIFAMESSVLTDLVFRFTPEQMLFDASNTARFAKAQDGLELLNGYKLAIGLGTADYTFHNTYIDLLVYGGIIALVAYLALYVFVFYKCTTLQASGSTELASFAVGTAAAILAALVMGLTIGVELEKAPWLAIAVGVATIATYERVSARVITVV